MNMGTMMNCSLQIQIKFEFKKTHNIIILQFNIFQLANKNNHYAQAFLSYIYT